MNTAKPYGNAYESEFFDVPLRGEGVPATMGNIYDVHYLGTDGLNYEPASLLNRYPGSADLIAPRDVGGIPCPSMAILIDGPVSGNNRDFFNYNEDIRRDFRLGYYHNAETGPVSGSQQDLSTTAYLAYVNSQLQALTPEQSAKEFSRVL